ncbi:MAG: hypothetical protein AAF493_19540 [Pseudomonadota bacterium]
MSRPSCRHGGRPISPWAALLSCLWPLLGGADVEITFKAARSGAATFGAARLYIETPPTGAMPSALKLEQPRFALTGEALDWIELACSVATTPNGGVVCEKGEVTTLSAGESYERPGGWSATLTPNAWRARSTELGFAGGSVNGEFDLRAGAMSASLSGSKLALDRLVAPAALGFEELKGRLELAFSWRDEAGKAGFDGRWRVSGLAFSDADGAFVAEGVRARGRVRGTENADALALNARAGFQAGALLLDSVLWDFDAAPVRLGVEGDLTETGWRLRNGTLRDGETINFRVFARGSRAPWALQRGRLTLVDAPLSTVYERYLSGLVATLPFEEISASGRIGLSAEWRNGPVKLDLSLADAEVRDGDEKFAIWDLTGDIRWRPREVTSSTLAWGGFTLGDILFGAEKVDATWVGDRVLIERPLKVEVLDGALIIEGLSAQSLGGDAMRIETDASLEELSVEAMSASFGWPPFSGRLDGGLKNLVITRDAVTVDGGLNLAIFGGTVQINELRLDEPFDALPGLTADIEIEQISLGQLTNAFQFGGIEGGLDGYVRDLELRGWEVTAFDGALFSTPDDALDHRISQRAIDSLASLGGGPQALLSQTFLRFFEEFSYDKLGLSCRLRNEVCEMGGVETADSGYFIVKGSGIPRIDVRGFEASVSWPSLIERIIAESRSDGPVIQ